MSLTTPLRMSSVDIDNPDTSPDAEIDKRQCSRCGEWLPKTEFRRSYPNKPASTKLRKECDGCKRIYEALITAKIAVKNEDGRLVVPLADGTEASLVDVATGIARRGYRIVGWHRRAPKPLAAKDAEAVAEKLKKKGYQLKKLGEAETSETEEGQGND